MVSAIQPAVNLFFHPQLKWRFYDGGSNGWTAFVGDDIFLPAHNRQYNVGDYAYIELGKKFRGTRIAAGPFLFSRNVVASGKKVGVQATFEQAITKRLTLAADWYSGDHSNGYFNPGVVYQLNSKFSFYATYQLGNSRLTQGNHQALLEIGYNFH